MTSTPIPVLIVKHGSHRELLKKNGYYAELFHAQAKWYTDEFNE